MKDDYPPSKDKGTPGDPVALLCVFIMLCTGVGMTLIPIQNPSRMNDSMFHFMCFGWITFMFILFPLAFGTKGKKDK